MSCRLSGVLPLLKPPGPSSHQVVQLVRRLAGGGLRAGHAGTLDPGAAGVLPVCLGSATRLADYLQLPPKEYRFELVLGVATETQDAAGRVVAEADAAGLSAEAVAAAVGAQVGMVRQRPPMYSARRHEGRRLYEYAREGRDVADRRDTVVRVDDIALLAYQPGPRGRALCRVVCGSGTYVRALCADIGLALGVPAHMGVLVRHRAAGMCAAQCRTLEEIAAGAQDGDLAAMVIPPAQALAFLPALAVDPAEAEAVRHGRPPGRRRAAGTQRDGLVRVLDENGALLAVARLEVRDGTAAYALEKVLAAASG